VRLAAVAFHPVGFSITLKDLTITQNAHPQPPVAQFPQLHASVHWQALLHGRLLADFVLRQPHVRIDHTQLQQEAADKVALNDEGWQQALEAIYPLKINHFRIENGDLTYIDDDSKRPLHISQLNLMADNIRNIPLGISCVPFQRAHGWRHLRLREAPRRWTGELPRGAFSRYRR
jgi:uncharacterized protein involved in outer membrane biogenesis